MTISRVSAELNNRDRGLCNGCLAVVQAETPCLLCGDDNVCACHSCAGTLVLLRSGERDPQKLGLQRHVKRSEIEGWNEERGIGAMAISGGGCSR